MIFKILILIIGLCSRLNGEKRQTTNGEIEGSSESDLNLWLGIPFAEPPIGDLRFKRPKSKSNWTNILETKSIKNACTQFNQFKGSEDCLYLNVIAPKNAINLPVFVWIHGGGFISGSGNPDWLKDFARNTNIIVVTIQYRLGAFGFLYMGTENAPGNMGLLDQTMAIKWVYDNIQNFGGDSNRITIGGQSAGAKSTGFHLLSKLSVDYFRNAILMSGSSNCDTAITESDEAIKRGKEFLRKLSCNQKSHSEQVECALQKSVSTYDIFRASKHVENSDSFFDYCCPYFTPIVDKYFINDQPRKLFEQGKFKNCSILIGSVKNEARDISNQYPYSYFPTHPHHINKNVKDKIQKLYSHGEKPGGDFNYLCPSTQVSNEYAGKNLNVFRYVYTNCNNHSCELETIFNSRPYNQYWSNFVKNDNPNDNSLFEWPVYKSSKAFLNLNSKRIYVEKSYKEKECELWEELH